MALTGFIAAVQGQDLPFKDMFTHGVVSVGVGSPPTQYDLIVDTGSSNTWMGANKSYVKTSTSKITTDTVAVKDRGRSFSGQEYTDTITLRDLVIQGQSIGVASSSTGFRGVDGVLGLGPVGLTLGTLTPDKETTIPTITDNLFARGTVPDNVVGIASDEITFGGTDSAKYSGNIAYVPITSASPANNYWGIDATFTYGSSDTSVLSTTAGIVDHSSSFTLLASDAYSIFLKLTGAATDNATSLAVLDSCDNLEPMVLNIGGTTFEIPVKNYRWPASQNTAIGGDADKCYLALANLGTNSGHGLDFILGYNTLKHLYVVLDTANERVGIAEGTY